MILLGLSLWLCIGLLETSPKSHITTTLDGTSSALTEILILGQKCILVSG